MQLIQKYKPKEVELIVIRNPINPEPSDIDRYTGSDIIALLQTAFSAPRLPRHIRLYYGGLTHENEVTPTTDADVDHLLTLNGRIYAVVVPLGLDPISWIIIGVSILVSVAVSLLMPMPSLAGSGTTSAPSPNNALAQRTNRQRLGGRVPDIVGEVWSTPDLVAQTYSTYIDNEEVEYSYMCIGRGQYNVKRALDDTTDIDQIVGANVQVFNPGQHIVLDTPAFEFGKPYTDRESELSKIAARRYTAVNGQVLPPPDNFLTASNNIVFIAPNIIKIYGDQYVFTGNFADGDILTIENASNLKSANGVENVETDPDTGDVISTTAVTYSLNGVYTVASVTDDTITLSSPSSVNSDWQKLTDNSDQTLAASPTLSTDSQSPWQGWFYTDDDDAYGIMLNLIAPQGIYVTHPDGDKFAPFGINFEVEYQQINSTGDPIVDTLTSRTLKISGRGATLNSAGTQYTWVTSDDARRTAAKTFYLYVKGRSRFRMRRSSKRPIINKGQQTIDEVKIKDFYSYRMLYEEGDAYNNDVTLVYVKTRATEGALSIRERKLKLLVQRYINMPNGGMATSKRADDIIYHLATDNKIGNLTGSQINTSQIIAEANLLRRYFGNTKYSEFCYTFDDNNLSSEETLQTVAQAVYSQLYRFNNKIQMHFERPLDVGVAVFNSHNMLPDTYEHSESFGIAKNYDGVTVKYTNHIDDAQETLHVPNGYAGLNHDEHTLIGVRDINQARKHAWRIWQKHVHSYKSIEFTAADESNIVVRSQRIDVADQHRADVMQGVITNLQARAGQIVMTLSEPIADDVGNNTHTLFIQLTNGQVDYMSVRRLDTHNVICPRLPMHTISTSLANAVQSVYQLVANRNAQRDAYIVSAKDPSDGMTNRLSAINYDARYYQYD